MCDGQLTRREAVVATAMSAAALIVAGRAERAVALPSTPAAVAVAAVEVQPGLSILPRETWAAGSPPKGPVTVEHPQFLLVHHTASANDYASAADVIRATYAWQTSPAKGWNDVCYEFFVGRDGDVWEGRAGALSGPVVADATGGSQGFAQLVCVIGTFTDVAPTGAALDALVKVIAWLALRDGIDLTSGATTTFTSRGSQRWRAGQQVTTPTIAGHRDMSYTECPGNRLYDLLADLRSLAAVQHETWVTGLQPAKRLGVAAP